MIALRGLVLVALLVVLGGCGDGSGGDGDGTGGGGSSTPAKKSGTAGSGDEKACLVVTGGSVNDGGFNQSAWEGTQQGAKVAGLKAQYVQAEQESAITAALEAYTQQPCKLIIPTSFLMQDATKTVSRRAPNKDFAIVDASYDPPLKNVRGLVFDDGQSSFLAGYLAAGMTKSGIVATYGGQKIPTVTVFMDGFADGVDYYNQKNGKDVRLLGWDKDTQNGTFVGNFTDQGKGKQIARGFMDQGADVIFGLGGLPDIGAAAAIKEGGGGKVSLIWPNTDGCAALPDSCDIILSSVLKNVALATKRVIVEAANNKFESGTYVGTLANDGVGLGPFHEYENKVPGDLKRELDAARQEIASGSIKVSSQSTPKAE